VDVVEATREGVKYGRVEVVARSGARHLVAESSILGVARRPWRGMALLGAEVARVIGVTCRAA